MDHLREGITFPIGLQILHLSILAFEALPRSCLRRLVNSPVGKQNIEICAKWLFLLQPAVARVLSHWFSPLMYRTQTIQ